MRIQVFVKSDSLSSYDHRFIFKIPEADYLALKNYLTEEYDEAWDRLCERIENEAIGLLDDWFIDHIEFLED